MLRRTLHDLGFLIGFALFFGADTPGAVVRRLRLAYRLVGVRIVSTTTVDGTERTVFLCPYRNLLAGRWGRKELCHDVLDRVDDGYVTFLRRYKDIDYRRPQDCAEVDHCGDSRYCFSAVSQR